MAHRFTRGKKKIWENIRKSQNMMKMIVWKRIFVKADGFLSFAKNMGKNIGKNISKSLHGKYSQKLLDHVKQSTTDALKTS